MKKPARVWRSLRWSGCNLAAWVRLLARQQYAFDPSFWPAVVRTTVNCALSSALGFIDEFVHGAAVRQTRLHEAPLFVLGHWRSGTTFLHDLLSLDERYIFADHLSTYFPSHFLLTGDLIRRRMGTAATHRRMDNVPISLDTPAEDEFALCLTGTPSPYLDMAFPNRPQIYRKYLDMVGVSPRGRAAWKRSWRRFLQRLTYRRPGRLLLKSPTHTARIKLLLEVFPDARFVHIVRNPYVVFSSTHKMILAMTTELSLQEPPFPALDEEIFTGYLQLMGRLEEDRGLIAPARFYQVRYEDLTADPLNQVRATYDHLDLGGFEQQRPRLERYLARLGSYQTNRYELAPELRAEITKRWGHFIRKYGYAEEE